MTGHFETNNLIELNENDLQTVEGGMLAVTAIAVGIAAVAIIMYLIS